MRVENIELKRKFKDPNIKVKVQQAESTFVTGGSENSTIKCDNW